MNDLILLIRITPDEFLDAFDFETIIKLRKLSTKLKEFTETCNTIRYYTARYNLYGTFSNFTELLTKYSKCYPIYESFKYMTNSWIISKSIEEGNFKVFEKAYAGTCLDKRQTWREMFLKASEYKRMDIVKFLKCQIRFHRPHFPEEWLKDSYALLGNYEKYIKIDTNQYDCFYALLGGNPKIIQDVVDNCPSKMNVAVNLEVVVSTSQKVDSSTARIVEDVNIFKEFWDKTVPDVVWLLDGKFSTFDFKNVGIVRYLLERIQKENPDEFDRLYNKILEVAVRNGSQDVFEYLINNYKIKQTLFQQYALLCLAFCVGHRLIIDYYVELIGNVGIMRENVSNGSSFITFGSIYAVDIAIKHGILEFLLQQIHFIKRIPEDVFDYLIDASKDYDISLLTQLLKTNALKLDPRIASKLWSKFPNNGYEYLSGYVHSDYLETITLFK